MSRRVGYTSGGLRFVGGCVIASLLSVVMFACGSSGSGEVTQASRASDGTQHLTVSTDRGMRFQPAVVSVRAGQPLDLTFRNGDESAHDLTLNEGLGQPVKLTTNGGETATSTVTFETPGTYTFECSIPGHALLGMRGTINVQ